MSNIDDILKKAQNAREAAEMKQKKDTAEKANRILSAIAEKATGRVIGWLSKPDMKEGLKDDIYNFFCEGVDDAGKPLEEYMLQGVGVYFGKIGYEPIARKDFGPYVLGLEESATGSHYPYTLKIQNRANIRLAKILCKNLSVEQINPEVIERILNTEEESKVTLLFTDAETFAKEVKSEDGEANILNIGTDEEVIGTTALDVAVLAYPATKRILLTRDDWYMGCSKIPENPEFIFDMRYVYTPQQ